MKKFYFLIFLFCLTHHQVLSQETQAIYQLFQKYFLILPYDKLVTDWVNEIVDNQKVFVDTTHKDSSGNIILRGYIHDWPVFEKLDSIKFSVGKTVNRRTFSINTNVVSASYDTSLFFQEIFYFPLQTIDGKAWKNIYKPFLKEFDKQFYAVHPAGGFQQGELIWFSAAAGLPTGRPLVTIDYGKLESRKLYFINLYLYSRMQTDE